MKVRKLISILLALGYLTAVQCRVACAFSMPVSAVVEEQESACHHDGGEAEKKDSKKPCCMTHVGGDEALLPTHVSTLAPRAVLAIDATASHATPAIIPLRLLGSKQNLDPPRIGSEVLSLSARAPRAPPAVVL